MPSTVLAYEVQRRRDTIIFFRDLTINGREKHVKIITGLYKSDKKLTQGIENV